MHNDYVLDTRAFLGDDGLQRLDGTLAGLPPGAYELISHPGYVDGLLQQRDPYTTERTVELKLLKDPGFRQVLVSRQVKLTTFSALATEG